MNRATLPETGIYYPARVVDTRRRADGRIEIETMSRPIERTPIADLAGRLHNNRTCNPARNRDQFG